MMPIFSYYCLKVFSIPKGARKMEASKKNIKIEPAAKPQSYSFSLAALTSRSKEAKKYCPADETLNYYRIRRRIRESGLF